MAKAATVPPIKYDSADWQPVYKSHEELNNAFSEAMSDDVRHFEEARRYSEQLLMRGE